MGNIFSLEQQQDTHAQTDKETNEKQTSVSEIQDSIGENIWHSIGETNSETNIETNLETSVHNHDVNETVSKSDDESDTDLVYNNFHLLENIGRQIEEQIKLGTENLIKQIETITPKIINQVSVQIEQVLAGPVPEKVEKIVSEIIESLDKCPQTIHYKSTSLENKFPKQNDILLSYKNECKNIAKIVNKNILIRELLKVENENTINTNHLIDELLLENKMLKETVLKYKNMSTI